MGFHYQLLLNAGQKYCKMLQGEHSAILLTLIKLLFVIKIFVLSILSGRFTQVLLDMLPKIKLKGTSPLKAVEPEMQAHKSCAFFRKPDQNRT